LDAYYSDANGVSADGSVVVGEVRVTAAGQRPFRWTSEDGMVEIAGPPSGLSLRYATGVSADGSVVAGVAINSSERFEAFRWTSQDGAVGLGVPSTSPFASRANAVSADGNVVVGTATGAFRWTSADGMVAIGGAGADGASADGSVVVGTSLSQAFRWTSDDGIVRLGDLSGGSSTSHALAVSADGKRIVGSGTQAEGTRAFLWTQGIGMVNLQDYLAANGTHGLSDWTLTLAKTISADGRVIAGFGTNPDGFNEAWIATIPEPSTLGLAAAGAIGLMGVALYRTRANNRLAHRR
jgi:probable HAF family extracellular repeat protein